MKKLSFINPIPKRVISINFLFVLTLTALFCTDLKAIPEDWPSTDGISYMVSNDEDLMQLSCKSSIQFSLDQNGTGIVTPAMLLTDNYGSYAQFKVVINQTGTNTVSCADIGKVITATVIDTTNGMMCWTTIVVEDKFKPVIFCTGDTVSCSNDPFALDYSAFVTISDNCDTSVSSYYDITLDVLNCANSRYSMIVHLKWTATDDYGNSSTCLQDIYFKKSSVDSVLFPANDTVYCPNADLTLTGVPTLFGDTISHLCQLLATHVDDSIIVCGGMMKVLRLWTVIDWCNSTMRSETQEILIADTTSPVINCPADITLYSNVTSCIANYTIPSFIATDACSPSELLILGVRVDSSYFLRPGDAINFGNGLHTLNYIAIDPCGNSDTCTSYVFVKDKISPSLICPPALIASLSSSGDVYLTAEFIAGKGLVTDNCCLDTVLVRRMTPACNRPQDTIFRDVIAFCCDDENDTLMIVLEAIDCSGNVNFCMMEIIVQEKNPPLVLECPDSITIGCDENSLDLNLTGISYEVSVCLDTTYYSFADTATLDSCGEGIIKRSFYKDFADGSSELRCVQFISIENDYVFNLSDVIWPADISILVCSDYHPDSIPSTPGLTEEDCGSVYFSFVDLSIQTDSVNCEYFERIWTAYSYCDQQTAKDTQTITLLSVRFDTLFAPEDTIRANDSALCSGFINLEPAILTGCGAGIPITNSFNNGGEDASGIYPVGTTVVIFTATDLCDTVRDTTIVIINDLEPPVIVCKDTVSLSIGINDLVSFSARSLLDVYSDNCTISDSILISFSLTNQLDTTRVIICTDLITIPDTFLFKVYVKDQFGNSDSCNAVVIVDDPSGHCVTALRTSNAGGYIKDWHNEPMQGVKVNLKGMNKSVISDERGYYVFNDIITNQECVILPSNDKNWLAGLTTQDIVKIQRHILGIETFDNPFKWIAADLDKNGRVTSADIVWLRKLILGHITSVQTNQSWRFINKAYLFKDPLAPLKESFEEQILLKGNWKDTTIHFNAIKVGDVTAFNNLSELEERLRKSDVVIENKLFNKDEIFKVDILIEKEIDIEGLQMSFDINPDAIELYRIQDFINQSQGRNLDQDEYSCDGKRLVISLLINSEDASLKVKGRLISLLFRAKSPGELKSVFNPGSLIANEIYPKGDIPIKILYTYKEIPAEDTDLVNWYVDPNPFKDRCFIEFQSNSIQEISFSLFDLTGKAIFNRRLHVNRGKNTLVIDGNELPGTGTFIYYIRLGDRAYHGKIVKSE